MTEINKRINLTQDDITKLEVDAIVNAANTSLLGGGGVDGAIHRVAGIKLLVACVKLLGCPTGKAKITKGYKLPAKFVIHTVGPVWKDGNYNEEKFLANCYKNSLIVAIRNNLKTIAFPNISTGVYSFPKEKAARIAIAEIQKFLLNNDTLEMITFVCFDKINFDIYQKILAE